VESGELFCIINGEGNFSALSMATTCASAAGELVIRSKFCGAGGGNKK
jgi:hypothetical protein